MTQTTASGIVKWTNSDPASIVQESQEQGDSIQAQLDLRERYDFVWPTSAERTAQTGMVQGSRGYQVDTKSEYLYDNSAWRLAASYAEYVTTANQNANNGVYTAVTGWSVVSANTTDSTFVSVSSNTLTIVNPGIYSVSLIVPISASGAGGLSTIASTTTPGTAAGDRLALSAFVANISNSVLSLYRVAASNTNLYMYAYQNSGAATNILAGAVLRVGRIG